jgi:hypothetical protein
MAKLRVIQWTTGKVGKLSLRAVLDDPRLELVGVFAYSDDKVGTDAGELCGRPKCGVAATNSIDALIALNADTVIYTPFMADLDHVSTLLGSGLDVLSTNLFLNYGGIESEIRPQLEAACELGKSSLYITGVNPGWINYVTAATTAVCRDVQSVSISETADVSVYESAETWLAMGMSKPTASPDVVDMARAWLVSFKDAVERIAQSLQISLDSVDFFSDFATTSQKVDLGWFCMEKDTLGGIVAGWNGMLDGRVVIQMKVTWYLTKHLNNVGDFTDNHYQVVIKGEPDVHTNVRFVAPESWGQHEWDTMTALPAVNAILNVHAAKPGILTFQDVGLPCAPVGLWLGSHNRAA